MHDLTRRDCLKLFGLSAAALTLTTVPGTAETPASAETLQRGFASPPRSARPWVYWFWVGGNVTREGITADLEAMNRVGIGGGLIMCVDQGTPPGPATFAGPLWNELFVFACQEAARLGLEVNMTNDAGWCGSGGPWVTPELSMQVLTYTSAVLQGGGTITQVLPQPQTNVGYYRDIVTLAFPTPTVSDGHPSTVPDFRSRGDYDARNNLSSPAQWPVIPPEQTVPLAQIVDVSAKMDAAGTLHWDAPSGSWTLLRVGHTSTAVTNHPAPAGGLGLETDKLSAAATDAHFAALMAHLCASIGPLAGHTLVSTHIDSWETGSQNWTPLFHQEFQRLRGYDPLPYLPAMMGYVVDSLEVSERFLWDVRQTVSELLVKNYAGRMRALAHGRGLRLSIEAYDGCPCDQLAYASQADEPMSEMWSWPAFAGATDDIGGWTTEMASAAHAQGRPIVGMETFTANSDEKWLGHPGNVKYIGDYAFCSGVNRFVFHRYAMQPWLHVAPGISMGPWGLHYERTQTWWKMTGAWHTYVARCQHLLRQGQFVADVCVMQAEGAPRALQLPVSMAASGQPALRPGHNFDVCSAQTVLDEMSVVHGLLTLPSGMRYHALVLPDADTMTPELLAKMGRLVESGATVIGPRPQKSPSLSGFPTCDTQVAQQAAALWDTRKIIADQTAAQVLEARGIIPDFASEPPLNHIHRHTADAEIYFIASRQAVPVQARCQFRVTGKVPELWHADTGQIEAAAVWHSETGRTSVSLNLEPFDSVFVVFRRAAHAADPIVRVTQNGQDALHPPPAAASDIRIQSASYGPIGDPQHTRDVTEIVQQMVQSGQLSFPVAQIAASGDPAFGVIKTLSVDCLVRGQPMQISAQDPQTFSFGSAPPLSLSADARGHVVADILVPGTYHFARASGKQGSITASASPKIVPLTGPWRVDFPPNLGAPPQIMLETLRSLSAHPDPGVRYFSGIAVYHTQFHVPPSLFPHRRLILGLGNVEVMAQVRLNGKPLPTLWKSPYQQDVTDALHVGTNTLEIAVANLWINRMIGDEQLPEDSERNPDGTLARWPQWLLDGQRSPTGRISFTTWRLWHKEDALAPSGLIGPVTLTAVPILVVGD